MRVRSIQDMTETSRTVRLLCYGDLHLGPSTPVREWEHPELDDGRFDAVVCIGDVIDDNREHASQAETGRQYEQRGRAFYESLSGQGVPVLAVPGNHDPVACTQRLIDGLDDVWVLHDRAVSGTELGFDTDQAVGFVGSGCEQFDLSRTFPYGYKTLNPVPDASPSTIHHDAQQAAETVLRFAGGLVDGEVTIPELATELDVPENKRDAFSEQVSAILAAYERLCSAMESVPSPVVCLSHESPFGTELDYHHSAESPWGDCHSGSIPLRLAIATEAPVVTLSGHSHHQCRDAVETVAGYRDVYNPGSPGVVAVTIDTDRGTVQITHDPIK
jgi:Icc-related predicted phosphoesterase